MKNALKNYKEQQGLTFRKLASICGYSLNAVYRHCNVKIPAEAAVHYATCLGIPRSELRPDLWPPEGAFPATPDFKGDRHAR